MATIRAKQAVFDIRTAFTALLDAARDLRALKDEYTEAGLQALWVQNPTYVTDHGFDAPTLIAALDDFTTADTTANGISAKDANWKKVRN